MPEKGLVPLMEGEEGNDAEDNALSGHHRVRMPVSKRDEPISKGAGGFGVAIGAYPQSLFSSPVHKHRFPSEERALVLCIFNSRKQAS